jgi:hypothetical protein
VKVEQIEKLSDAAAVNALAGVVKRWSEKRGFEALAVVLQTRHQAGAAFGKIPSWAAAEPQATPESGQFARRMLASLISGSDDEVAGWARASLPGELAATAHVLDPFSIILIGVLAIGGILAARVKKVGPVEFYEGIPKELGDIMKTGASVMLP